MWAMESWVSSAWESKRGPRQVGHRLGVVSKRERQSRQRAGMIFRSVGDLRGFGNGCATRADNTRVTVGKGLIMLDIVILSSAWKGLSMKGFWWNGCV